MEQSTAPRFFLGANSKTGFFSLYDSFTDPVAGDFLWVIKGGPGCGKSSFMRRIGEAAGRAGLRVEYILCSGDPDSLDGVRFPDRRVAYVDGTAPHVIEATYPGAASLYLDLGAFLDAGALEADLPEIMELNRRYKAMYASAYALLSAGAALLPKNLPGVGMEAAEALTRRVDGIAARELRPQKKQAAVAHRFLSARSCQGHVVLTETLRILCRRVYVLDNALGLGHAALARLAALAEARGWDAIHCHDPLEPEKLEALILPERSLAFLAAEDRSALSLPEDMRHLRLDVLAARRLDPEIRPLLRQRRRESRALLRAAEGTLAQAKALHDALEAVYHPHVDFDGVGALAEDHIRWLLE